MVALWKIDNFIIPWSSIINPIRAALTLEYNHKSPTNQIAIVSDPSNPSDFRNSVCNCNSSSQMVALWKMNHFTILKYLIIIPIRAVLIVARRMLVYFGAGHLINTETALRKIGKVYNDQLYTFRDKTIIFFYFIYIFRGSSGGCGIRPPLQCLISLTLDAWI